MKNKQQDISFEDFVDLVDISVKSGKLHMDYSDFFAYCKKSGFSSYLLNLIIKKAKEFDSRTSTVLDNTYFVIDRNIELPEEKSKEKQIIKELKGSVSKLEEALKAKEAVIMSLNEKIAEERNKKKRRVWPYWILITILISVLVTILYVFFDDPLFKHKIDVLLSF